MKRGLVVGKKGLSTLVTSLILILLVLVAVGILYSVYINFIKEGVGDISMGKFTINLEVQSVVVNDDSIDVNVKRNVGDGALTGIKFVVSDGVKTEVFDESTTMQELGSNTFNLTYSGLVKDVSVAPIVTTSSGKESVGNEVDKFEISEKRILENLGAVSWWKFEGNAKDEIGGNDGELKGNTVCNVEGKSGNACDFDGSGDYVQVSNADTFNSQEWSVASWVNIGPGTSQTLLSFNLGSLPRVQLSSGAYSLLYLNSGSNDYYRYGNVNIKDEKWHHIVFSFKDSGNYVKIFVDGVDKTGTGPNGNEATVTSNWRIGPSVNGMVDEMMIFNKALTAEEVKALYALY